MKSSKGFTLIELMVVVAIIGILASVALPSYSDYTTRAKVGESIALVGELKPEIISYFRDKGRFPKDNDEAGMPNPEHIIGNHVKRVFVENGAMHIEMGNKVGNSIQGQVLTLRPIVVIGSPESPVSWVCGNAEAPEGMEAMGENKTSLESKHLPAPCRS